MAGSDSRVALPGLEYEPEPLYVLNDLEQVRAVANPLRVDILDCLGSRAMTVREVGQALGINSTKLYYHVGELERVDLVRLVHTEVQSGIQQKYFRARARYYYLSSELLNLRGDESDATASFLAALVENAAKELRRTIAKGVIDEQCHPFMVSRRQVRLHAEDAGELQRRVKELDEFVRSVELEKDGDEFEFVVAVFPKTSESE